MAQLHISFLQTLEKFWQSSVPVIALYQDLLAMEMSRQHGVAKSRKTLLLLTKLMLLRQLNRQPEANTLQQKNKVAFNRITEPLYKHRWKRLQLVEAFKTGDKTADIKDVEKLILEAESNRWAEEQLRALFLKHIVEKFSGHFSSALQTLQQVKLLATEQQDLFYIKQSAWGVAHIYYFFGEKQLAFDECIRIKNLFTTDFTDPANKGFYVLLGDCYAAFHYYNEALEIFSLLQTYFEKASEPDNLVYIVLLTNTAYIFQQKKDYKRAEAQLKKALRIANQMKLPMQQLTSLLSLANLYFESRSWNAMKSTLTEAQKISAKVNVAMYNVSLLELQAKYAKWKGNARQALDAYEKYHEQFAQWKKVDNEEKLKALKTKQQLEVQHLKEQMMKKEMEHLEQELQLLNANMEQKNKLIKQFAGYFNELEQTNIRRKEIFTKLREMVHTVQLTQDEDKTAYSARFNEAHSTGVQKLMDRFPQITNSEAGTAIMLTKGLSNKDIASFTLTTVRNVEKHRLSLRKKMSLKREEDLVKAIKNCL